MCNFIFIFSLIKQVFSRHYSSKYRTSTFPLILLDPEHKMPKKKKKKGQIYKAKLCSNSPVITKSEGMGKLSLTLWNFFLPNLEITLTLGWLNFKHFVTYIFASWKHYSTCVIYEGVELDWRTPLTFFFPSIQRTEHIFPPLGHILFDATSPPFNINS